MTPPDRARLTIDLDALAHNRAVLAAEAPGAEIAAVVKSDGYGLGVGPVARRLHTEGTRSFFVARIAEGEALRNELAGRDAKIYILDGLRAGSAGRMAASALTPVISTLDQAYDAMALTAQSGLEIAMQIDTGMNRQGLSLAEARALTNAPEYPGNLRIVRDARMAVVHAPEDEGIMLGEGEDFSGVFAFADLEMNFGTHGFGEALRRTD